MRETKQIRAAAVAGMFYPGDTSALQEQIQAFIREKPNALSQAPKALIVPHAGTIYSGSIAATAYRSLLQYRHTIRKVILLGPAHRIHLNGLALPSVDQFETPLGKVDLDGKTIQKLVNDFQQVSFSDEAHSDEHSLEVQLPFLQEVLSNFKLIPFVVGDANKHDIAEVIAHLWGGADCLVVISTDLSHFYPYSEAVKLDTNTAQTIESFQGEHLGDQAACGRIPLGGLLHVALEKGMRIKRLDLRNSGDTAGSKDQVVGYGSWALFEP